MTPDKLPVTTVPVTLPCHQVDNRQSSEPVITPEQAVKLCDRNFGIGGDGVSCYCYGCTQGSVRVRQQQAAAELCVGVNTEEGLRASQQPHEPDQPAVASSPEQVAAAAARALAVCL